MAQVEAIMWAFSLVKYYFDFTSGKIVDASGMYVQGAMIALLAYTGFM